MNHKQAKATSQSILEYNGLMTDEIKTLAACYLDLLEAVREYVKNHSMICYDSDCGCSAGKAWARVEAIINEQV